MPRRTAQPIAIKEVTLQEARSQFERLVEDVARSESQVVIRDGDRVVARILPGSDPEEARRRFFEEADALRQRFADLPTRKLNQMVDQAVGQARASRRARTTHAARHP